MFRRRPAVPPLAAALADPRAGAVLVGMLLGGLAWAMARFGDEQAIRSGWAGVFASVMVVAGGAAFVLHALHRCTRRARQSTSPGSATGRVHHWALLLALSCLAAMQLLAGLG